MNRQFLMWALLFLARVLRDDDGSVTVEMVNSTQHLYRF